MKASPVGGGGRRAVMLATTLTDLHPPLPPRPPELRPKDIHLLPQLCFSV